jgi:hypothetical protein
VNGEPLEIEIAPDPEPAAAAALVQGVQAVVRELGLGTPPGYASPWRRAALREQTDQGLEA